MFSESISNSAITQFPKIEYPGVIRIVRTGKELEGRLRELGKERLIGFDTETKPSFRKGTVNGVALLQLATDSTALLIRLKDTGIPQCLVDFFENPQLLKIGAAIQDDIKALQKITPFVPSGFLDLQNIVPQYGIECLSVRKMAGIVLSARVSKSQQLSNWDADIYTDAQQQYAATDAWVCRKIYLKLTNS